MTDANGVTWEPYIDGSIVGYKLTMQDGSVQRLYFNPSDCTGGETSDAFVYLGPTGDPGQDASICYIDIPGTES